jgi:hypothetical protein
MKAVVDHAQQVGEIHAARVLEADDHHRFVLAVGTSRAMKGLEVSTTGTRWKLMWVRANWGTM